MTTKSNLVYQRIESLSIHTYHHVCGSDINSDNKHVYLFRKDFAQILHTLTRPCASSNYMSVICVGFFFPFFSAPLIPSFLLSFFLSFLSSLFLLIHYFSFFPFFLFSRYLSFSWSIDSASPCGCNISKYIYHSIANILLKNNRHWILTN